MNVTDLLIGLAIGDAFGAGVEFQDRNWIRENVDFTEFINVRHTINVPKEKLHAFTEHYSAWDYTDDTEMTIGMMKALISNKSFSEALLVEEWTKEYQKGIEEKGVGRNGHGSMRWYYDGEKSIEEIRDFQRDRKNPGNAPAMRSVPLGLIDSNSINQFAEINANATHPNINAILSSQCIAWATEFLLVQKGDPKKLISYCFDKISFNDEYKTYLTAVNALPCYDEISEADFEILCGVQPVQAPYFLPGIHGVPSDSKYTAGCVLYILKSATDAMDALKKSIHIGGDVDSVASITTGIMAARSGLKSIPDFMLNNIEAKEYLIDVANTFVLYLEQNEA